MRYVVSVKHDVSKVETGFNINIDIVSESGSIGTGWLVKLSEIMETDFKGFHITSVEFEG